MPVLYGQQGFEKIISPAPSVAISTQIDRFEDGRVRKYTFSITLRGKMLVAKGGILNSAGVSTNDLIALSAAGGTNVSGNSRQADLQQKIGQLQALFKPPVPLNETAKTWLQITPWDSSGSTSSIICYPRVKSLDISEGPWTDYFEYTINLDADYLKVGQNTLGMDAEDDVGVEEDWSIEPDENQRTYKLNHVISAQATSRWVNGESRIVPGFEIARKAVLKKLAPDNVLTDNAAISSEPSSRLKINGALSGMTYFGLGGTVGAALSEQSATSSDGVRAYNATRNISVNESGGKFSVTENWTIIDLNKANLDTKVSLSGSTLIPALEDFTISVKDSADNAIKSVSVDGTITGLRTIRTGAFESSDIRYGFAKQKMDLLSATDYKFLRDRANENGGDGKITARPTQVTIGHNKLSGVITYNVEFTTKPLPTSIAGLKMVDINYTDSGGSETYAAIDVLGRIGGPVFQALGSATKKTRDITIELVVSAGNDGKATRPARTTVVGLFVTGMGLMPTTSKVFLEKVTEQFSVYSGKYTLNLTYAYGE
jgi:hypothetical protein